MTSKQFINHTILLNTDGGGERVAAWVATTKRICGPVSVFTPRINLVAHPVGTATIRVIYQYSNGQTEGKINKLKSIKRQMYGRANFDLLRQRLLLCA